MTRAARQALALAFALLVGAGAAGGAATPAAAAELTVSGAESEMIRLLNVERAKAGLVAVRVDTRLMTIARQRSADMATKNYFSHVQPDGRSVFDYIAAAKITWYGAGEIIAWNTWPTLAESTVAARDGWMGSSLHKAIVMSKDYNYVGIGVAVSSSGKKLWTGVFMKGPDRTGAYVRMGSQPATVASTSTYRTAKVAWGGNDILLQTLTSGLRHFQVQLRIDGGSWVTQSASTLATSWNVNVYRGRTYDFRVRACDKAGNCGTYSTVTLTY